MSVFDDIRTWTGIEIDTPTPIMFEEDEPISTGIDAYQNVKHIFHVNGGELLSISSKPLMRALKPFTPLSGKTLVITRTGRGHDTRYSVKAIE
jgi:hypothetical protein